MSLPATSISASVFRVQVPLGRTCEKASALMHRQYHAAASAEGWMKERVSTLQQRPSAASLQGLKCCLGAWASQGFGTWSFLEKEHWNWRNFPLRLQGTAESSHLWEATCEAPQGLPAFGRLKCTKYALPSPIFYWGHFPPVWDSKGAWALFHTWGISQLGTAKARQSAPTQW